MNKNQIDYINKFKKEHYKRVAVEFKKAKYSQVKTAADRAGESVNGYIKKAVDDRLARENLTNNE